MGTTVEEIWLAVLAALEEGGYGKKSIGLYRYMFGQLGRLAPDGVYTPEVGAAFAAEAGGPRAAVLSKDRMQSKRRVVRLADEYVATGTFDLGRARGLNLPNVCCITVSFLLLARPPWAPLQYMGKSF